MRCSKCKKNGEDFVKYSTDKYGHQYYRCNKCNTEKVKKYRKTENGKKNTYKAVSKSIKNNKEKHRARLKVYYQIKTGKIIKPKVCEKCGKNKKLFGHHTDYSKPLSVLWVCLKCHSLIHKNI